MVNGKFWTEDDDVYLEYFARSNCGKTKDAKIEDAAVFLGRSKDAVISRLVILRKRNSDVLRIRSKWTLEEDEILKQNYLFLTNKALSERLNRSIGGISERKRKLGLTKIRPVAIHKKKIIKMVDEGYYRPQIARALDVNLASLTRFMIDAGIPCKDVPYEIRKKKRMQHDPGIFAK